MVPAALAPALALTAGAAVGIAVDAPWRLLLWLLPLLLVAAAAAWHRRQPVAMCVAALAAFGCCGLILGSHAREQSIDTPLRLALDRELRGFRVGAAQLPDNRGPVLARLRLTEDAAVADDVTTLRARVVAMRLHEAWVSTDGGVVISVGGAASRTRADQWRRGRIVEAPVLFRRPARYLNDGVPDFERDAALEGISLLGAVKSGLLVNAVERATAIEELAGDLRAYVRRSIGTHVARHSALSAAVVTAVLIGDRSGLPDDIRLRLQVAGTYHVIAISGGNIAILAALIMVAFVPLGLSGRRAAGLTLLCLVAYAVVVTSGPSVWRATLVAVVYLLARLLDHRTASWQATAVAAAVLAIAEPLDVRNAGFLLTFGATTALLAVTGRFPAGHRAGPRLWLSWLVASVTASAAVEIALLPVMAETFSRITAAGLVLNILAVPAMAVVQIAGLAVVFANPIDSVSAVAGWVAHLAATAILDSARLVDAAPWLAIRVPPPSAVTITMYYLGLAVFIVSRVRTARAAALLVVLASGMLIIAGPRTPPEVSGLRLTMFDVGQGDALLLQMPAVDRSSGTPDAHPRRTLMVDTGGRPFGGGFDIGSRVLEPAVWARGISRIDTLLLTHGDPDHIGGALPIIDDFQPSRLWEGTPVPRAMSLRTVLDRAAASGTLVENRRSGEEFRIGDVRILVLHPPPPDWERQKVRNDDSVVLEMVYGEVAVLLTGDIGADVERAIAPQLVPAKTRILKVAHHGSRTSTSRELLDVWRPQIALISCGRGNPFGHPAPDVVARLEAIGAHIYRTDLHGELTVDTDGRHVVVRTFTGGSDGPRRQ